jgi:dTDP-glucose 4,6-dehydratase
MTRIAVSGIGGFVGHHLFQHILANTDWDIVGTDSFRHQGKTDRITEVLDGHPDWAARTEIITHDLTAPVSSQMISRIGDIDYLIAMASESHVDRSIADPVPFVRNNVDVMLNTLELARVIKPRVVLHVSTDEIYGPVRQGQPPHPEWDPILPSNPYSASKAAQEAIAISYWRSYGVPCVITNLMNVIGERQGGEKFLPILVRKILLGETVQIHGTEDEIGSRNYLHARNAADAWLFILGMAPAMFPQALRPDRYNVAGLSPVSNLALAQEVARILGRPLRYEFTGFDVKNRPGHDPHYGLDMSKLLDLGWKPPVELYESLERTVRWTVDHPAWLL